jgi:hypothetical protein
VGADDVPLSSFFYETKKILIVEDEAMVAED